MSFLDIKKIFLQDKAKNYSETYKILIRYPDAEIIPVNNHWNIPELNQNQDLLKSWNKVKREYLVLGVLSSKKFQENGRSTDYISPSFANGCAMACNYCVEEGTLIRTSSGDVAVETLQEDDEVLSYDSSSEQLVSTRVWGVASRDVEEVVELEVGGQTLTVSLEHPILTRRGWVEAQHLTEHDEVLCA